MPEEFVGSQKLAALMHKLATDPRFPLSAIPARYLESSPDAKEPVGVAVVEVPVPQQVQVEDQSDQAPPAPATADEDDLMFSMLLT